MSTDFVGAFQESSHSFGPIAFKALIPATEILNTTLGNKTDTSILQVHYKITFQQKCFEQIELVDFNM